MDVNFIFPVSPRLQESTVWDNLNISSEEKEILENLRHFYQKNRDGRKYSNDGEGEAISSIQ